MLCVKFGGGVVGPVGLCVEVVEGVYDYGEGGGMMVVILGSGALVSMP